MTFEGYIEEIGGVVDLSNNDIEKKFRRYVDNFKSQQIVVCGDRYKRCVLTTTATTMVNIIKEFKVKDRVRVEFEVDANYSHKTKKWYPVNIIYKIELQS